jgi:amino-acid N-acetyltransferase
MKDLTPASTTLIVEKARIEDAQAIHDIVNGYAARGDMLPRTLGELYENLRDFYVVRDEIEVIGCVALHIMWSDLAEVRSLAVSEKRQVGGVGSLLVQRCIEEAKVLGLQTVFALTYRPGFFERLGFQQADVMTLPRKVWNECYRCPKFPSCNEIAVVLELSTEQKSESTTTAGPSLT